LVIRSNIAPPAMATPNLPMPLGIRLVLNFGAIEVPHSPSARERWICALSSTARPRPTTQEGLVIARKSWLLAQESHDSTLQLPTSPTSAVSTP